VRSAVIGLFYAVPLENIVISITIRWNARETSRNACKLSCRVTVIYFCVVLTKISMCPKYLLKFSLKIVREICSSAVEFFDTDRQTDVNIEIYLEMRQKRGR
jgi:hypothetical protein